MSLGELSLCASVLVCTLFVHAVLYLDISCKIVVFTKVLGYNKQHGSVLLSSSVCVNHVSISSLFRRVLKACSTRPVQSCTPIIAMFSQYGLLEGFPNSTQILTLLMTSIKTEVFCFF